MGTLRGVAFALVLSCGGSQHAPPGEPAPKVKTYGPLGIKADAKAPHQAVILGTDANDGSTLIPLPTAASHALVDAMWVKLGPAPTGGMTPVKLATAPNPDGSVQVGIYEEFAGGTGPQWRAGVWVSAIVAATTLGKDLTDFTFSASSGGYIDGASASGLMAGGFLAAMTGATIDPATTMTGTINPDGTIGPVGGIPEKFLGSIAKGKKRLGYPIGMRYAKSEATGTDVDLDALARDHGAVAIEIADVHDAYKLLTGKQLPEPVPVAAADMTLDPETVKGLDAKYKEWQARLSTEWTTIVQLESAGRLPALLVVLRGLAQQQAEAAEQLHKQRLYGAAYSRILSAWAYASATTATYDIIAKVQANDVTGAVAALAARGELGENAAVFKKIGALRPATLGGHLEMMAAFEAALRGWVFKEFATKAVASTESYLQSLAPLGAQLGSPQVADQVAQAVAPTLLYIGRTLAETALATQELDFESEQSVKYLCSVPNVRRMATSFQSASAAALNYFDALLITPLAQSAHLSDDDARQRVAMVEPDYLVAYMASRLTIVEGLPAELKAAWGEQSLAWGLLSLAGSELAYGGSAVLIAKYYSLGIHNDAAGRIQSIEHDKAFTNMLASAERSARASARAARIATGAIPVQAKLAYELATVERSGDLAEKVDALSEFWAASAFAQTAVMLARN